MTPLTSRMTARSTDTHDPEARMQGKHMSGGGQGYGRFFAMIATSTVIMFGLMYLNTYELPHARFSETRVFMALYMGAMMAIVMIAFMWGMYKNTRRNWLIVGGSAVLFLVALFLLRSQATVDDTAWMKAMIPHHSIALLTSERANIDDVRVQALADDIIAAQKREIAEMEWLIRDIAENGRATDTATAADRPVPDMTTGQGS